MKKIPIMVSLVLMSFAVCCAQTEQQSVQQSLPSITLTWKKNNSTEEFQVEQSNDLVNWAILSVTHKNFVKVATTNNVFKFFRVATREKSHVNLAWDRSQDPTVVGYILHSFRSIEGPENTARLDVGPDVTGTIVPTVAGVSYSFFVTAYNDVGLESDPSNIIKYTAKIPKAVTVKILKAE